MGQNSISTIIIFVIVYSCFVFGNTVPIRNGPGSNSVQHSVYFEQIMPSFPSRFPQAADYYSRPITYPNQKFQGNSISHRNGHPDGATYSSKAARSEDGLFTSIYKYFGRMFDFGPTNEDVSTGRSSILSMTNYLEPRQVTSNFEGLTQATQNWSSSGIEMMMIMMGGMMQMASTYMSVPEFSSLIPAARRYLRSWYGVDDNVAKPEMAPGNSTLNAEERSSDRNRTQRNVQPDEDLTYLANVVISAIQSGQCMQRSICLLGNQIGESYQGKVAFILADKLVPDSVRSHEYFETVKKSFTHGKRYCNRYRCSTIYS